MTALSRIHGIQASSQNGSDPRAPLAARLATRLSPARSAALSTVIPAVIAMAPATGIARLMPTAISRTANPRTRWRRGTCACSAASYQAAGSRSATSSGG